MSPFLSLIDKTEIENVISLLDSNKSVGPNCIPKKIKLLKKIFPVNRLTYLISLSPLVSLPFNAKNYKSYTCA